ncbi:MAG: carboxypeptidase-like regulatory domain-containing protein, partial [Terracidiphilus sp.]
MDALKRTCSVRVVCLSLLYSFAFAAISMAQVDRATLNGTVTDASGAVVPNVKIALDSPATGLHRETMTNRKGTY